MQCCLEQGFLDGILALGKLAVPADEHAKDLRRKGAQQVLERGFPGRFAQALDLRRRVLDAAQLHNRRVLHNAGADFHGPLLAGDVHHPVADEGFLGLGERSVGGDDAVVRLLDQFGSPGVSQSLR